MHFLSAKRCTGWRKIFVLLLVVFIQSSGASATDLEAEIRELKSHVKRLNDRIEKLEEKALGPSTDGKTIAVSKTIRQDTGRTRIDVIKQANKDYQIPGIDTTIKVGGRVKLDAIYNSKSVGGAGGTNSADLALTPGSIPVGRVTGENDQFTFSIRESRLWFKSRTASKNGDLNAYFELDFFARQSPGDQRVSNSHTPRLRHGYGTFENLLFGQTWTTFMNVSSFPEHNDSTGPVAMVDVRQPQIRWTQPFSWGDFRLAVEEPETTLTDSVGQRMTPDDDRYPDLVSRLTFTGSWGETSIAGLLREIRSDRTVQADVSDEAIGGAVNVAGRIKTIGSDNIRFSLSYGNALGRYIALNAFNTGTIDAQGQIELTTLTAGFISYQHWWTNTLRSTFTYSLAHADNDLSRVSGIVTKNVASYHANLLWSPILAVSLGLEYIHARRKLENGQAGSLNRFQLTSIYNF